ncbi:arylsulfotransferase family protein [Thermoproteota archaeon]
MNKKGYIDPGTGGYLLTSLWGWLVGIFTVVITIIVHFFRVQLKGWWIRLPKKYKLMVILIPVIIVIGVVGFFIYKDQTGYKMPKYDPALVNVTVNTDRAYEGYTFLEGKLIDMSGEIVNEWPYGYLGVIDDNGDLYAQQEYESAIWGRYSWNGSMIWEKDIPIHHEILLTPQDTVIVLTKKVHEYKERNVEFDVILELDKNGTPIKKWSTWDHLEELRQYHNNLELDKSPSLLLVDNTWKNTSIWGGNYDYYHMNAVSLVPENSRQGQHPAFTPGNYIISFRHGSMVFIIDSNTGNVLWRAIYDQVEDNLEGPHSPHMMEDGNIMIYDNGRYREWTRLLLLNPVNLSVEWEYRDDEFFSYSQGYVQPLPNDNLLVTESEEGHVFELDPSGSIVWEWWHPEMYDNVSLEIYGYRHDLYRAIRYEKEFIDGFLE